MQALIKYFNDSKYIQYLLFIVFSFIDFYLIKEHIFFRDDARPILIAISSNSFIDFFNNARYELNPLLYHLIVWIVNKLIPVNVFITKALFLLINISTIFIILFLLKIPNIYKLLILVQVPQIGLLSSIRQYSLTVLVLFTFTHFYIKEKDKSIWIYIILFLLCQSSFHGMVCAVGLYAFMICERYYGKSKIFQIKDLLIPGGIILCMIQLSQPQDVIVGLKRYYPLFSKVNFTFGLHFIYDSLLRNPFSGILFLFFIYKTFHKLKLESKFLGYGFLLTISFLGTIFYLICALRGYSNEKHFWMFSYTVICLLLISNHKSLTNYLQNRFVLNAIVLTIISCIPFDVYTAKKYLSYKNSAMDIAKYLDKHFPKQMTLHEIDYLSDTINVYREFPKKYYSLNAHRFNYYVKWNHPRVDYINNSHDFIVNSSQLIDDIEKTPEEILNTEPIIIITANNFINNLKSNMEEVKVKNKYKLTYKKSFIGSNYENHIVYQLNKI